MSPKLKQFFKDYLAWVNAGASNNHPIFQRQVGLCNNAESYGGYLLEVELKAILIVDFGKGNHVFPFESDNEYLKSTNLTTNPKRIAYVRAKLGLDHTGYKDSE